MGLEKDPAPTIVGGAQLRRSGVEPSGRPTFRTFFPLSRP